MKKRGVLHLVPLVWIVLALSILALENGLVNAVAHVCAGVMLLAAAAVPAYLKGRVPEQPFFRKHWLNVSICTCVFLILLPIYRLTSSGMFRTAEMVAKYQAGWSVALCRFFQATLVPAVVLAAWMLFAVLFDFCCKDRPEIAHLDRVQKEQTSASPSIRIGRFRLYKWLLPAAVVAAAFQISSYPFLGVSDMLSVYDAVTSAQWSDWHTIGYSLFLRLALLGGTHPFTAGLLQCLLWLLICNYTMAVIDRNTGSRTAIRTFGLLNCIIFLPALYTALLIKDTMYSMCMAGLCTAVYDALYAKRLPGKGIPLLLFAIGVSLFRHAGWLVAVLTLAFVLAHGCRRRRVSLAQALALPLIPALAFFIVNAGIGGALLHMERNPAYVKFSVPLYVAAHVASTNEELLDDGDIALMKQLMSLDEWKQGHESGPYLVDTVSREWGVPGERILRVDNAYGLEIVKLNARIFLRSPLTYLSILSKPSSILWMIAPRPDDGSESFWPFLFPADFDYAGRPPYQNRTKAVEAVLRGIESLVVSTPTSLAVFCRGGLWLLVLLSAGVVFAAKGQAQNLLLLIAPLSCTMLLLLSCPAQDFRFALPNMATGLFIIPVLLFDRNGGQGGIHRGLSGQGEGHREEARKRRDALGKRA